MAAITIMMTKCMEYIWNIYANVDFYHLIWLQMILSPVNVLLLHLNMGSEINHFHLVRNRHDIYQIFCTSIFSDT